MMRVVLWGTYDTGKPRMRILRHGLALNHVEALECHREVWRGVEDKSMLRGGRQRLALLARWLLAYPGLIAAYLRAPRHDAVLVGYLGHVDVLILWPFARLRGVPIVWDAFLSLYNTIVEDRRMVNATSLSARLLYALEWLACRAADRVVLDTRAHAAYFEERFGLGAKRCDVVWVGAEPEAFFPRVLAKTPDADELVVLFYGQFIPLHGIETIVEAARLTRDEPIRWVLIGSGQEEEKIRALLRAMPLPRVEWLPWVDYRALADWIGRADVCLGIFGQTDKAARVIPNKVFQILMSGKPLITRDSPAIRELLDPDTPGVRLVPAADAQALAHAVRDVPVWLKSLEPGLHASIRDRITPESLGRRLSDILHSTSLG